MLLCVDVGNTNTVLGLYDGEELVTHWRISTDAHRMPDEYGIQLLTLAANAHIELPSIDGAIVASVVPPVTEYLTEMIHEYVGIEPLVVGGGIRTGVPIRYSSPQEVGADRIVNAVAAHKLYGGPACIVDFGTATTFDALSAKGEYLGGAISPGIRLAAEALYERTAKLPRIDLKAPDKAVGANTIDAMRSGILYGYIGLVEGMVKRFRAELGANMKVIATGGLAEVVARHTDCIEVVDTWLTLKGLRFIYELNEEER